MMDTINLGLNEALISVSKSNSSEEIKVFKRTEECFGCQLEKLISVSDNNYKVETSHEINLELRQGPNSSCRFGNLTLNSHAHYRINVTSNETSRELDCKFETSDGGDCLTCPFAILLCIIFTFMALDWVVATFVKSSRRGQKLPSSGSSNTSAEMEQSSLSDVPGVDCTNDNNNIAGPSKDSVESDDKNNRLCTTRLHSSVTRSMSGQMQSRLISSGTPNKRIECLDAFRGLTIAGMIFVNYGGAGYTIWQHKSWNGITLADFVFPFFIFAMGASIAISIRSQIKNQGERGHTLSSVAWSIIRRSLILMIIGLCLNSKWLNYDGQGNGLDHLRLTGVLQRFSISYLIVALVYSVELTLAKWIRAQNLTQLTYLSTIFEVFLELLMTVQYLAIYVYVTFFFEYDSNCPIGYTGPGGQTENGKFKNCTGGAAAWLDRTVLGEKHMYDDQEVKKMFKTEVSHDPEGILGYTTSVLLTMIGLQCGKILNRRKIDSETSHRNCLLGLVQFSLVLAVSCSLTVWIPINKRLWSLTFILVSALAAFIIIALLYILLDIYDCKRSLMVRLFISAGQNSIFLYVGHSLIKEMLPWWLPINDPSSHLQLLLRLAWATFVWLLIAHYMAQKRLFIRV